jgi:hypothetical protein
LVIRLPVQRLLALRGKGLQRVRRTATAPLTM